MTRHLALIFSTLLLLCCASAGVYAQADVSLTVAGVRNISFGRFYRASTSAVPYSSSNSAEFTVTGRQNRNVRITVTTTSLVQVGASMPITVQNSDCAYSLDDGVTWLTFTTGTLFQDTQLPTGNANGSVGTIRVRVGGSLTSSSNQNRGDYAGTITVSAVYR